MRQLVDVDSARDVLDKTASLLSSQGISDRRLGYSVTVRQFVRSQNPRAQGFLP
jgi:hypothetical protein